MSTLFLIFFVYFLALMAYYLFLGIIGLFEGYRRKMEDENEDYGSLGASPFAIPVSIIVPARNEATWIADCVQALLNLDYPEFEVIVVNDGSTDRTQDILTGLLGLEELHNPYADRFHAGKVHGIYKSRRHPNIKVLSKASGYKKAGAVNAGLDLARYKYVCVIDADTVLERDALLKVMAPVERDPDRIVAVGSYFGLVNGCQIKDGRILKRTFLTAPIVAYQNLEYIRSFIGNRLAWNRLGASPLVSGGFGVWRRDILLELGGYSSEYSSEDLEFTFRARDYIVKNKKDYAVIVLPYQVGWTAGPPSVATLIKQRNRWQRVTNEAVAKYRHMLFNPRYGALGWVTIPYFLFYEVLGVFFEATSLAVALVGLAVGFIPFKVFITFYCFMALTQALVSLVYLFNYVRCQRASRFADIAYLAALSLVELFWYRWIIMFAKLSGTASYLKGYRVYDQFHD